MTKEEEMYSILNELGIEKTILENTLSQPQEDLDKYPENLLEQYKEELEMFKRTIDYIEKLQKENEELKNKVVKRDNELIELDETSEKEFLTKQEVKENYIPKDKIRELLEKLNLKLDKLKQEMDKEYDTYGKSSFYLDLDEQWDYLYEIKELLEEEY